MGESRSKRPTDASTDAPTDRLTLAEAAHRLGVTKDAVRKRVNRGSIPHERGPGGTIYVYLDASTDAADTGTDSSTDEGTDTSADALLEAYQRENELLRDTLAAERRANEENRRIIAGLVQRIPELEAPPQSAQEAEYAAESAAEGARSREEASEERTEAQSAGSAERVPGKAASWWRRIFGG